MNNLHFKSIVLDCHNDTMLQVVDEKTGKPVNDLGENTDFHIDIKKAKKGGLDIGYFAAFSDLKESFEDANRNILSLLNGMYWTEKLNSNSLAIARSFEDIRAILEEDKLVLVPTIEGAYSLIDYRAEELLKQYRDMGVQVIAYVWNSASTLATGTEGDKNRGLTELGYKITKEMNKLGIVIDVSHMNEKTFWDLCQASKSPIIASHSCCSAITSHVRNLKDEQIKAIAEKGGVINVNFWWELLGNAEDEVSTKTIVNHIDYIRDLVGIDYIGLGSDFDGASMPKDIKSVVDLPKITEEMIKRGYSEQEIRKVLALNNLRVLREVQNLSVKENILDLSYDLNLENGQELNNNIKLQLNLEEFSYRIILNGEEVKSGSNTSNKILNFNNFDIIEQNSYHIITFEIFNTEGKKRISRIFYY